MMVCIAEPGKSILAVQVQIHGGDSEDVGNPCQLGVLNLTDMNRTRHGVPSLASSHDAVLRFKC